VNNLGEMGEVFRLMTEMQKKRKSQRLKAAKPFIKHLTRHTDWHYSTMLGPERVDYWPTTSKWRCFDRNYHGDVLDFMNFLKKRGWNYAKTERKG